MTYHYRVILDWDEQDQIYIASLPDFGPYARTHGSTRAEAVVNAEAVLEALVETYQAEGRSLPTPAPSQVA